MVRLHWQWYERNRERGTALTSTRDSISAQPPMSATRAPCIGPPASLTPPRTDPGTASRSPPTAHPPGSRCRQGRAAHRDAIRLDTLEKVGRIFKVTRGIAPPQPG